MKKFGLAKDDKIYLKNDFKLILEQGKRVFNNGVILWWRPNPLEQAGEVQTARANRIGIIVSKKLGSAVQRNRCKRLLREAFRLNRHFLKEGVDCIFYPKDREKFKDYQSAVKAFLAVAEKAQILKNNKDPQ